MSLKFACLAIESLAFDFDRRLFGKGCCDSLVNDSGDLLGIDRLTGNGANGCGEGGHRIGGDGLRGVIDGIKGLCRGLHGLRVQFCEGVIFSSLKAPRHCRGVVGQKQPLASEWLLPCQRHAKQRHGRLFYAKY